MPGVSQGWSPLDPTVVCARVSMRTTPTVYPFRLRILSCQILFPAGAISQAKMEVLSSARQVSSIYSNEASFAWADFVHDDI